MSHAYEIFLKNRLLIENSRGKHASSGISFIACRVFLMKPAHIPPLPIIFYQPPCAVKPTPCKQPTAAVIPIQLPSFYITTSMWNFRLKLPTVCSD